MAHSTNNLALAPTTQASAAPAFSPLYQQIKTLVLQKLQHGDWRPAQAIPSEQDLAALFNVSQGTVRKAIDELANENILVRRQGKGTFVATHATKQIQTRFLRLAPLHPDQWEGQAVKREITQCTRVKASAEVARALSLKLNDNVIYMQRVLSYPNGVAKTSATILEDIWLPSSAFKGLSAEKIHSFGGTMYALFESEFGVRMVRASEKITAVNGDSAQCASLQVAKTTPLLCVERVAYTYNDQAMELRRGLYRTDYHYYSNELS